jgi:hypothetical protein
MEEVVEVVACPVCGKEVTMEDVSCPHCRAAFEPGTAEEPAVAGRGSSNALHQKNAARDNFNFDSAGVQTSLLGITYVFGYGSIIAANYVSSGGLLNASSEMMLVTAGIITIAFSILIAFFLTRVGDIRTWKINYSMIALFLLLLPPLILAFKW